jgi:hypothetical protein
MVSHVRDYTAFVDTPPSEARKFVAPRKTVTKVSPFFSRVMLFIVSIRYWWVQPCGETCPVRCIRLPGRGPNSRLRELSAWVSTPSFVVCCGVNKRERHRKRIEAKVAARRNNACQTESTRGLAFGSLTIRGVTPVRVRLHHHRSEHTKDNVSIFHVFLLSRSRLPVPFRSE